MSSIFPTLAKGLERKVFGPDSDVYDASLKCFPSSKSLRAINSEAEIATKVAVRGGCHNPFAGSANIDNGITIDLRNIDAVEVNQSKDIVSVGVGAIWGQVYDKLNTMVLSVVGGHVYDVGVGGFTLGAGTYRKSFPSDVQAELLHVYIAALNKVWQVAIAFELLGFILSFCQSHIELKKEANSCFGLKERNEGADTLGKTEASAGKGDKSKYG